MRAASLPILLAALAAAVTAQTTLAPYEVSYDGRASSKSRKSAESSSTPSPSPTPSPANTTATPAALPNQVSVTVDDTGFSPNVVNITKGGVVSFTTTDTDVHRIMQSVDLTSCSPLAGGFDSKNLTTGVAWNYTIPQDAPSTIFFFNIGDNDNDNDCKEKKLYGTINVGDSTAAKAPGGTTAGPGSTSPVKGSAGTIAPALASLAAIALAATCALI